MSEKAIPNDFTAAVIDIGFWERTLELQCAYWVFEKAALKYKQGNTPIQ